MCPTSNIIQSSTTHTRQDTKNIILPCVPSDEISQAAYQHAREELHHVILAHSLRVFIYAQTIGELEKSIYAGPGKLENSLLFVACLFHDIGTSATYSKNPVRFEIEGGDAAVTFLEQFSSIRPEQRHDVWVAIAVHATPQIAERIHPLARLVRLGPSLEWRNKDSMQLLESLLGTTEQCNDLLAYTEQDYPRGMIEKVLSDSVVEQALECEMKAPMVSWPGALLVSKRENPYWEGINKAF